MGFAPWRSDAAGWSRDGKQGGVAGGSLARVIPSQLSDSCVSPLHPPPRQSRHSWQASLCSPYTIRIYWQRKKGMFTSSSDLERARLIRPLALRKQVITLSDFFLELKQTDKSQEGCVVAKTNPSFIWALLSLFKLFDGGFKVLVGLLGFFQAHARSGWRAAHERPRGRGGAAKLGLRCRKQTTGAAAVADAPRFRDTTDRVAGSRKGSLLVRVVCLRLDHAFEELQPTESSHLRVDTWWVNAILFFNPFKYLISPNARGVWIKIDVGTVC